MSISTFRGRIDKQREYIKNDRAQITQMSDLVVERKLPVGHVLHPEPRSEVAHVEEYWIPKTESGWGYIRNSNYRQASHRLSTRGHPLQAAPETLLQIIRREHKLAICAAALAAADPAHKGD